MKKKHGFTLIELVIFIVIMGVIASIVAISYDTMLRGSPWLKQQTTYSQAASLCMEWFLGQRTMTTNGYGSIATGTTTPSFCTAITPSGYNVSTNVSNFTLNGDTNYKKIDISLTKQGSSIVVTTMSTIVANY